MIDYERLGKRILEERKYLRRLSQEKMAEDLGLYQADISNLEKAKKGSGITDLDRLDMIAAYFGIPLESLLFGSGRAGMEKYTGKGARLKEANRKMTARHASVLRSLMGLRADEEADAVLRQVQAWTYGPCTVYAAQEVQSMLTGGQTGEMPRFIRVHLYAVWQDEAVACLTAGTATVMQHVYRPALETLRDFMHPDILDPASVLAVLNPYVPAISRAADEEEAKALHARLLRRMDDLRALGEDRTVFYVDSAYVREDCRRHGLLRLMLDVLRRMDRGALIWLSLEPGAGEELMGEYTMQAVYEPADIGQLHLNASIAERLGFEIDERTAERTVRRVHDGAEPLETVPVRRTAYALPKEIRQLLRGDRRVAEENHAVEALAGAEPEPEAVDVYQGAWKEYGFVFAIRYTDENGPVFVFARGMTWEDRFLGVSRENPAVDGKLVDTLEKYDRLEDARGSRYYPLLRGAERLLGAVYFGTVRPEELDMDDFI